MHDKRKKIAVLISGRGSNLQALIKACQNPDFPARIALVISNIKDAGGLELARQSGILTEFIDHNAYATREGFEDELTHTLQQQQIDMVCLAGFMRLLGKKFVADWQGRLINIHPSLLPSFKGLNTHKRALQSGVKLHGCTVHYVSVGMDEGKIIGQAAVPVVTGDDETTLGKRVLEAEHILYPACLAALTTENKNIASSLAFNTKSVPVMLNYQ